MAPPRKRSAAFLTRQIRISAVHAEWDPLFAYAESQGLTPSQAITELALASLNANSTNPSFIAAARRARHDAQSIALTEVANALRVAWQRIVERGAEMGIVIDDSRKGI